jgi:hypothetical protein
MKTLINQITWLNKSKWLLTILLAFLCQSCADKDVDYYKRKYSKNKSAYNDAKYRVDNFIKNNNSIFKYRLEYTGKKLFRDILIDDTTITHIFDTVGLSEQDEDVFYDIMYNQDIQYIIGYRDSIKYVFSGMHKDIIVNYPSGYKPTGGYLIDTNTYLFFEGTRAY